MDYECCVGVLGLLRSEKMAQQVLLNCVTRLEWAKFGDQNR